MVARLFLERPEEAEQLGHTRLINLFSPASGDKRGQQSEERHERG